MEDENLMIGILLYKENNDALVKITLPQDADIYASEYKLYLPDKKLLQEWIAEEASISRYIILFYSQYFRG